MKYEQKRVLARTSFAFGDRELRYTFRYGSTAEDMSFDYFQVTRGRSHTALRDWSRFQLGMLLVLAGGIAIAAHARLMGFTPLSLLCLAPGAALLTLFIFAQTHFVVLQAAGQPVWIIDDKQAQTIVAEIDRRRRDQIADLYGALNLANEPYLEVRKIEWLVTESVFTRDEANEQIARVNAARAAAAEEATSAVAFDMFTREAIAI